MVLWQTTRGIFGESMLFMFTTASLAAATSLLDMLDSPTPKEGAVIATSFAVVAAMLYAARTYWDEGKWKRFAVTTTLAPTLLILSVANVAHTMRIDLDTAILGSVGILMMAMIVTGILYLLRWIYLFLRWCIKRRIEKYSKAGDHRRAIQEAEKARCRPFQHRNYIEDPANFSSCKSAALRLSRSLDAANRPSDATRVRLVANGWTVDQANSFLEEQSMLADARRLRLIQPSN